MNDVGGAQFPDSSKRLNRKKNPKAAAPTGLDPQDSASRAKKIRRAKTLINQVLSRVQESSTKRVVMAFLSEKAEEVASKLGRRKFRDKVLRAIEPPVTVLGPTDEDEDDEESQVVLEQSIRSIENEERIHPAEENRDKDGEKGDTEKSSEYLALRRKGWLPADPNNEAAAVSMLETVFKELTNITNT